MSRLRRLGLGALMLAVLALTFKPVVEGDGIGYFSYLHALVVDRSLDMTGPYAAAAAAHVNLWPALVSSHTSTGLLADYFPIGPALLSLPAYLLALAVHPAGDPQYAAAFVWAFTLTSLLAGLMTLALCWRLTGSAVVVAGLATATALPYYMLYEPSYSHTFSALAVTLFVLAWWRGRKYGERWWWWLGMGALGGAMALVRWQDGPLVLIALLEARRGGWRALLMVPAAIAVFLPQLVVDRVLFGTWLPQRPAGQDLQLWPGHYVDVLFSSYHGLFVWHPITLLAAFGFVLVREWRLRVAFVFALAVETLLNGAAPDWWGGFAFGARRFLDLTPFWAIGLAALADQVGPRRAWAAVAAAAAWNVLLMANFTYVIRTDHDTGYRGLITGQFNAVRYLAHQLTQGAAGRDLLWWRVLPDVPARPLEGIALLVFEGACLAAVFRAAGGRWWRRSQR